jgi:hypothetical protein
VRPEQGHPCPAGLSGKEQLGTMVRSKEAIEKMQGVAELLVRERRYREAFTLYDELYRQLWGLLGTVQSELALHGGLPQVRPWQLSGLQSWHVESTANIFCARAYGMSLTSTLETLAGILRGHLRCLCSSPEVSAGISRDQVLAEFGLSYLIHGMPHRQRRVAPLFALVTAVVDRDHHLRWIRLNQPRSILEQFIVERLRTESDHEGRSLAGLLADYLRNTGETQTEFSRTVLRESGSHSRHSAHGRRETYGRPGSTWSDAPPFDPAGATEAEKKAHYGRLFGLQGTISRSEIRSKYLQSVALYHPDKVQHLGPELRELAERKTKEINAAYDWFKRTYDL